MQKTVSRSWLWRFLICSIVIWTVYSEQAVAANISAAASVSYNGNKYVRYDYGMSWTEARDYCTSLGGHLVTITSQAEQNAVVDLITNGTQYQYWLGGKSASSSKKGTWITGESFTYSNWASGEPNNYRGNEGYMQIYRKPNPHASGRLGSWNDISNDNYISGETDFFQTKYVGFICEYENAVSTQTQQQAEQQIINTKNDDDLPDSTYNLLQARAARVTKNSIRLRWNRITGAAYYVVYGNRCGINNRYEKITTVRGTSYTGRNLKSGKYYKYIVVAVNSSDEVITKSKTVHSATKGGKVGNDKAVTVNVSNITLTVGERQKIRARAVAGTLRVKRHRKVTYESSNTAVAVVSKTGRITAKGSGTCYIFAYAQNGKSAKVKVSVQ